ncbi:MAG: C-GCAxxG-C-C family protein [Candidatus Bathyarchaeota archaeon]|nr:C-GCAxxG-C-C family protein [Candidatus Bathyarchaeota archaeon]
MVNAEKVKSIRAKAHANENMSGCSQAVLAALQEGLSIGDIQSLKAATAFAGGMARRGESCGALVGALMALGVEEGRDKLEDLPRLQSTIPDGYALSEEFMHRLEKEYDMKNPLPSTLCRDLQQAIYGRSWNLADPAQRTDFIDSGGHGDAGCLKVCGIAAEVAAEFILKKRGAP